jgi:AraC-like DNA-binding protein/mannose-6-phosphate isomerase-like protein (cupin superfamily)
MWQLSDNETRETIRLLGIDRRRSEAFGFLGPHHDVKYAVHSHAQNQLLWSESGVVTIEAEKRLYVVAPGLAVWIPAQTPHATSVRNGSSATLFIPKSRRPLQPGCHIIKLTPLLRELLKTATTAGGTPRFRRALFDLIDELSKIGPTTFAWPSLKLPSSRTLIRVVEFLMSNLDSVSVADLAGQAGMSERSLRRHFRGETGIPVSTYLGHARMVKAMQMLAEDRTRSVAEVSVSVGFNNPSAFACAFRRATGMSPTQFRSCPHDQLFQGSEDNH